MLSLILDTSCSRGVIAIVQNNLILWKQDLLIGLQQSPEVIAILEHALQENNLSVNQLEQVVIGTGPGSFTGMRMGAIIGKTLAWAKKIPLIGLSTLHGFTPPVDGPFALLLDAKSEGIYIQIGEKENEKVRYPQKERLLSSPKQIEELLEGIPTLISPHKGPILKKLSSSLEILEVFPDPLHMSKLANNTSLGDKEGLTLQYFKNV